VGSAHFIADSLGEASVKIFDKPCITTRPPKAAPYVNKELQYIISLCQSAQLNRLGPLIVCSAGEHTLATINVAVRTDGGAHVVLNVQYLYEGRQVKRTLRLSLSEYNTVADGVVLSRMLTVTEPVKHCGSEEKMLYPALVNGAPRFIAVHQNGDVSLIESVEGHITLIPEPAYVSPTPPMNIREGLEVLNNVHSQFAQWATSDVDKARIMYALWAYLGVYWRYVPRLIPYLFAPRGSGKTTILIHVRDMAKEVTELLSTASGAAVRDMLTTKHVIADDVDEHLTLTPDYDHNLLSIILAYYYGEAIARVSPDTLKRKMYRLRGGLIMAGSEPGFKFRHRAVARRLKVIALPRAFQHFRYKIEEEEFSMALSLLAITDSVNSYQHGVLPEDPVESVNVIFNRYTPAEEPPKEVGIKPVTDGDPIIDLLYALYRKIVDVAEAKNISRYRYIEGDRCYIAIDARRIPKEPPTSETISVTKPTASETPTSVTKTVEQRYYHYADVFNAVKLYLRDVEALKVGFDRKGHAKVFIEVTCEWDETAIRNALKEVAAAVAASIKSISSNGYPRLE